MKEELNKLLSLAWRSYNLDRVLTHKWTEMTIQGVMCYDAENHQVLLEQSGRLSLSAWGSSEVFSKKTMCEVSLKDKKESSGRRRFKYFQTEWYIQDLDLRGRAWCLLGREKGRRERSEARGWDSRQVSHHREPHAIIFLIGCYLGDNRKPLRGFKQGI